MIHRAIYLLFFGGLLLSGCGGSPEADFSSHGISFTKPAGWKVTDEEYTDEANTLFVEKEGMTSSGLVLVQWYSGPVDHKVMVEVYTESLNAAEETTGFERSDAEPIPDTGKSGYQIRYSFRTFGLPHSGKCLSYECGSYTILLGFQGADEDQDANAEGFKLVEESIVCE
ncbi:MAG: hypothetical protein AAGN35_23725 [Bacteroidota bacterium]